MKYFGTSLWQTQLKFQLINQTPPHPINTDLGTQLLLSQGLLELCPEPTKIPLSPKPQQTDRVMVPVRGAESTSSEEERALRTLNWYYYYTRKYVNTRTKPKPCNMSNTENVRMRDVLNE